MVYWTRWDITDTINGHSVTWVVVHWTRRDITAGIKGHSVTQWTHCHVNHQWFSEHDGTSQLGSRSQCHVSSGSLNTMERHSSDQWSRCHATVTVSRNGHNVTWIVIQWTRWDITAGINGHSVTQWSHCHVNHGSLNTMGHHSWDQVSESHSNHCP